MNVSVKILNHTANDTTRFRCPLEDAGMFLEWYGAFYAGDDILLYVNGTRIYTDRNLQPLKGWEDDVCSGFRTNSNVHGGTGALYKILRDYS